jgi:hypothetical protein
MSKTVNIKQNENGIERKVTYLPKRLEILVYGVKADEKKMKPLLESLQKQINKFPQDARAVFYIDNGEKTDEEKKAFLIKESCCKYYVFLEKDKINDSYVKTLVAKIKEFEFRKHSLKEEGVVLKKQPEKSQVVTKEEMAKIISIAPAKRDENSNPTNL